ncbi:MAG: hypothetical protein AABY94_09360 [Nitrospirota bacterium]
MDAKRKGLIAIGLVAVWGGVAYWQWVGLAEPVRMPLSNVSGSAPSEGRQIPHPGGLRVHLEQLDSARTQREAMFTTPRNIFALPSSDGTLSIPGQMTGGSGSDPVSEQVLQPQAASVELAQYRYLGFVRMGESAKGAGNTAVLSKNEEVVTGRAGQHLEPHLVVKTVTPESVTLRDVQARIDHTVSLTEDAAGPPQP